MQLGNIIIHDPRTMGWHEEHQFTPWLMENIHQLGNVLGIDIDPDSRQREVMVGRYIADIVAQETATNRTIIIENQLRNSAHSHLGQLLTYAAGTKGSIIVWVCHQLRDEHRQVLDWLNSQIKDVGFFGVEFKVISVDDSKPAIEFTTVLRPPEWEETSAAIRNDRPEKYRPFFQKIVDELRDKHRFTAIRIAQEKRWVSFAAGHSGLSYSADFVGSDHFRVELYIQTKIADVNKNIFDGLEEQRAQIENQLSTPLKWERGDGKQFARISLSMPGSIADAGQHPAMQAWAIEWLLKFKKVFGEYLPSIVTEVRSRSEEEV